MSDFESRRIEALRLLDILDSMPEQTFNDIVVLASKICNTPISLISFVDSDRQWFKAKVGLQADETARDIAFCDHSIRQDKTFIVSDASLDPTFKDNPLVTGEPNIRFYAGAVLRDSMGFPLGTLCVIDQNARVLSTDQIECLEALSRQVMTLLELRAFQKKVISAEQRAHDSEDKAAAAAMTIENFLHTAPIAMAILEGPEHTFIRVNGYYSSLVGERNLIGSNVREAFPDLLDQPFYDLLDKVYKTGEPFQGFDIPVSLELGEIFIDLTYAPRYSTMGEVCGIGVFAVNVTERRRAQQALEENERFLRLFTDSLPANIGYVDKNWDITFVNSGTRKILNRSEPEIIGRPMKSLLTPEQFEARREPYSKALAGIPQEIKFSFKKDNGEVLTTHTVLTPDFDSNGKVKGVYVIAYDHTAEENLKRELLVAKDEAEAANSAKSFFLANMSHEIRSPLGAIMGFSNLARETPNLPDDVVHSLNIIERNSNQVLRIIDDILDLSKVEAGKMEIETIKFSLLELLADFTSMSAFKARENCIEFIMKAETPLPSPIYSDPTRLRQILSNIVGNALKFTKKGTVTLVVRFSKGMLELKVQDTGIGISHSEAQSLFRAFHQADVSTSRKFGGTGLGLVLTKSLAQALGGEFWLDSSEAGKGSVFIATAKIELCAESRLIDAKDFQDKNFQTEIKSVDSKSLAECKILVVDDSPDNLLLIRRILKSTGADIDEAGDGIEAVSLVQNGSYDLILMDVQMPNMDGYEAVQLLRAMGVRTPVIAITAHAMKDERDKCLKVGYSEYIAKPIDKNRLIEVAQTLVAGS